MMNAIVYVETNFLIALLFPHLDSKVTREAHRLLEGNGKDYTIMIPFYSTFESLGTTRRKKEELKSSIGQFRTYSLNLKKNGLISAHHQIFDELDRYFEIDFEGQLNDYLNRLEVIHIDEHVMDIARNQIQPLQIFSRGDAMDAYILASILRHAQKQEPHTPKIFMSTNKQEFDKVPDSLKDCHQLIYTDNFNFRYGQQIWNEKFGTRT